MAKAGSNRKKQRQKKVSAGLHGAKKHPLGYTEKILLGKGAHQALSPITQESGEPITPWLGVNTFKRPFDAEQAKKNRELYPDLFNPYA